MYVVLTCNIINIIWISQLQQIDRKPLKVFSKKLDELVSFIHSECYPCTSSFAWLQRQRIDNFPLTVRVLKPALPFSHALHLTVAL